VTLSRKEEGIVTAALNINTRNELRKRYPVLARDPIASFFKDENRDPMINPKTIAIAIRLYVTELRKISFLLRAEMILS
jgi:hypothetical protein